MAAKNKKNANAAEGKEAALQATLDRIEDVYGKGAVMRLGDKSSMNIEAIPTGSIALDRALGVGGIPKGRITEIYGPESSGKTTVALHIVAESQKRGGTAAFIDAEHALDPVYAQAIGVDVNNLLVSQPDNGEQALEIADALVRSGAIDLVVVDSVAALTPRAEIEGEMGDTHVGLLARLMSQALRKLTANVGRNNTTMIFINQVREKIGVLYGNPETTTGGRALKFYSSVRLEVRRGEPIKKGEELIGNRTKVRVVKNKVAPPFKRVEFDLLYGEGISRESGLLDVGVENDIVTKKGSWFSYGDVRLGQGRDNARIFLEENPDVADKIEQEIRDLSKPADFDMHVAEDDKENAKKPSENESLDELFDDEFLANDLDEFDVE